ncbi:hypothetical protein [Paraburkholderia sp. BR14312]
MAELLDEYALTCVEEPLRCDRPLEEWRILREQLQTPIARGVERSVNGRVVLDTAPGIATTPNIAWLRRYCGSAPVG